MESGNVDRNVDGNMDWFDTEEMDIDTEM